MLVLFIFLFKFDQLQIAMQSMNLIADSDIVSPLWTAYIQDKSSIQQPPILWLLYRRFCDSYAVTIHLPLLYLRDTDLVTLVSLLFIRISRI